MNRDRLEGNWRQCRGRLKTCWGNLTNDCRTVADGARDRFLGRLQERYGIAKESTANQLKDFLHRNRNWNLTNH